jgi:hypothetical protein
MRVTQFGLLVLSLGLASAAIAARNPNPDVTRQELQNFDKFLDTHPVVDGELTKNPRLIERSEYISAHPELKSFLADHPGVREEMKETPRFFMHREEQFERSGRDVKVREAASLDVFLDTHPRVEKELRKDPGLAKNPEYLSMHPEFADFLGKHPAVRADLSENPGAFMRREAEYERAERREANETAKQERREERAEARLVTQSPSPKPASAPVAGSRASILQN